VQLLENVTVFRYRDQPGMIGRVGTMLGEAGVNIVSAAVGWKPDDDGSDEEAVMVVTAEGSIPQDIVDRIIATDGFTAGRTVSL
jgi:D-3-phosphoglycerate dehydrogenase